MELVFAHVAIAVTDLCRSTDFYCHVLGAKVIGIFESPLRRVMLNVGGQSVELLQYMDADNSPDRLTGVINHIAFKVVNLDQIITTLLQQGVCCEASQPKQAGSKRIFFFYGPDGERIEFIEE